MARQKQPKQSETDLNFIYRPRSQAQKDAEQLWRQCRVLFFTGCAGTGKTTAALGMALRDSLAAVNKEEQNRKKLWLARPHVACGEDLGFTPGDLAAKLSVWLGSFYDCFDALSGEKWTKLEKAVDIEMIGCGMLRGRSLRNGTLIIDEGQLLTYDQIVCAVTRIGENSRVVICGDPDQSDRYEAKDSPLIEAARRLRKLDLVGHLHFPASGQLRDPLIADILDRL